MLQLIFKLGSKFDITYEREMLLALCMQEFISILVTKTSVQLQKIWEHGEVNNHHMRKSYHTIGGRLSERLGGESGVRGSRGLLQRGLQKSVLGDGRHRSVEGGARGGSDGSRNSARHRAGKGAKREHFEDG